MLMWQNYIGMSVLISRSVEVVECDILIRLIRIIFKEKVAICSHIFIHITLKGSELFRLNLLLEI
jgi:hypothetical protein